MTNEELRDSYPLTTFSEETQNEIIALVESYADTRVREALEKLINLNNMTDNMDDAYKILQVGIEKMLTEITLVHNPQQPDVREEVVKILKPIAVNQGELLGKEGVTDFNGDETLPIAVAEELLIDLIHSQRKEVVEQFSKKVKKEISRHHRSAPLCQSQERAIDTLLAQWEKE